MSEQGRENTSRATLNLAYVKSILIVDDSPLIRRSLRTVFEQQPDWAVCGEAEDGYEGIAKAKTLQPDLIVIDLAMPRLNGISACFTRYRTSILICDGAFEPPSQNPTFCLGVCKQTCHEDGKGEELLHNSPLL